MKFACLQSQWLRPPFIPDFETNAWKNWTKSPFIAQQIHTPSLIFISPLTYYLNPLSSCNNEDCTIVRMPGGLQLSVHACGEAGMQAGGWEAERGFWCRLINSDGWPGVLGRHFRTRSVMGRLWDDRFRHLDHPPNSSESRVPVLFVVPRVDSKLGSFSRTLIKKSY